MLSPWVVVACLGGVQRPGSPRERPQKDAIVWVQQTGGAVYSKNGKPLNMGCGRKYPMRCPSVESTLPVLEK